MSKPWAHQTDYVDFALRYAKTCAAHDTGVGKTRSAVMVADALEAKRILVICPAIACMHWVDQFAEHGGRDLSSIVFRNRRDRIEYANIVIVPLSLLSTGRRIVRHLMQYEFDLVVIDEAHALKTPDSKRTVAVYGEDAKGRGGLAGLAPYVVLLTATLMPNHPAELWPHLRALRPELLEAPGYDSFVERYCETKSRPREHIVGANRRTAADLRNRLATFRHRVRKKDVLDLPPLIVDVWPVHVADLSVPSELLGEWRIAEARLMRDVGTATGEEALAVARSSPHSATQRRLTGAIKIAAMIEALRDELDGSDHKIISFAYHTAVIDEIEKRLFGYGVTTIDGRTPGHRRRGLVEAFQKVPRLRLFNGQIVTAGESIDLTVASSIWIMESDWTPKTITQAIGRAHRHGQTLPVNVRFLALQGSIDEALSRTLARKTRDIDLVMENVA